jgi:poly(3-hydroxybutyrate) depolymerase
LTPPPGAYSYMVSAYIDGHGCLIGERYLIHGMDHYWSGGSTDPKLRFLSDPAGPSAQLADWQFLSRFTLRNTARSCRAPYVG